MKTISPGPKSFSCRYPKFKNAELSKVTQFASSFVPIMTGVRPYLSLAQ